MRAPSALLDAPPSDPLYVTTTAGYARVAGAVQLTTKQAAVSKRICFLPHQAPTSIQARMLERGERTLRTA